jgi:hypothetical protein
MSNGYFTASGYFVPFHPQGQEGCQTPARSVAVGAVDAKWLFPQERAPSPPHKEGCLSNGSKDSAPRTSDGLQPAPNPRMMTRLDECEARCASAFAKLEANVSKMEATVAKMKAALAEVPFVAAANFLEALRAWPGIVQSVKIPSSTTTRMSSPTAAGLSDTIANATLQIKEVCTRQNAHLVAFMAYFRSFADNFNQQQPSTHASFALIDDDDNNDKDEAIHIVLSINNADVKLQTLLLSLPPLRHFPIRVQLCSSWGGNVRCRLPTCCRLLSRLPSHHKRQHANLNGLATALVVKTDLGCPITPTRPFPPTFNQ